MTHPVGNGGESSEQRHLRPREPDHGERKLFGGFERFVGQTFLRGNAFDNERRLPFLHVGLGGARQHNQRRRLVMGFSHCTLAIIGELVGDV